MGIQLSFLALLVSIAVASTRLIYHDGVSRQFSRMGTHCRMLAALIVVTSVYSASIGFSIHEQCMREIQQKDSQIKALAQQKFADDVDRAGQVVLTTLAGNKICIGDDDGLRNGAGDSGRCFGELRRSGSAEASSRSGGAADSDAGIGCDGSGDDGLLVTSELLGKLREWSDGCFAGGRRITPSDHSVSF
jgi:hypothetical protein